ncbi:hypothetical protein [Actinoplanes sp. NPDC026619]|uniref:hypothetical protein n=1 Tax=Actinoplanes sp. NPDC026619 TaxID=3155798 RepID=UPI003410C79C
MTVRLSPGPAAGPHDARAALEQFDAIDGELERVRAAAAAWRTGMAGLLAALVGFGLLKGRTDIGQLAAPWPAVTGGILLATAVTGGFAAIWLLRAAHGRPERTRFDRAVPGRIADHVAAGLALHDLRRGIAATLGCATLLIAAVATTWYGPAKGGPKMRVQQLGSVLCGTVTGLDQGRLTLKTDAGLVTVDLTRALTVKPVDNCP